MTVSFFLKRNKERSKAIREALTYGLSIIVIYVLLGLLVTLLFGANALNALSTNAWFNIFFALLLIIFAASFFGAFELTLPASWSTKIDQKSERTTGLLSIFLMAFTLVLVSFSCTGPIIGFLLVAVSTQGNILGPTLGMLGFSIGLAIPFALFALFPSLLKSAPKSGGWMNTIKVVLGFIELAFALKFLSVADLAYGWRLLDREVFLAIWIALFGLLGTYLMGWLRFPHDEPEHRTNVPQFFLGLLSFAFTIYMIPGLWGAPLKAISAFTPPMYTQDYKIIQTTVVEAPFKDYEQGMSFAKEHHKPVVIDFTGFGCVNCRKMEAAVWTDEEVARRLTQDYVLISLYVDDKTPLAQPIEVEVNGQKRTLRTIGDKWSHLQATKFGANTQPFYVLLDEEGKPLGPSRSYDENIQEYINWLDAGLTKYKP
jgi:thiol:disulfide interchange protein DsbD